MTNHSNYSEYIEKFFDNLKQGNTVSLREQLSDDIVWHQPGQSSISGRYVGIDAVLELLNTMMVLSEGSLQVSLNNLMQNEHRVTATVWFSAHTKFKSMAMSGIDLFELDHQGKIQTVCLFSEYPAHEDAFWG